MGNDMLNLFATISIPFHVFNCNYGCGMDENTHWLQRFFFLPLSPQEPVILAAEAKDDEKFFFLLIVNVMETVRPFTAKTEVNLFIFFS